MTESTMYVCDYCDHKFDTKKECLDHEDSHIKLERIMKQIYEKCDKYPSRIICSMEDGTLKEFVCGDVLNEY